MNKSMIVYLIYLLFTMIYHEWKSQCPNILNLWEFSIEEIL